MKYNYEKDFYINRKEKTSDRRNKLLEKALNQLDKLEKTFEEIAYDDVLQSKFYDAFYMCSKENQSTKKYSKDSILKIVDKKWNDESCSINFLDISDMFAFLSDTITETKKQKTEIISKNYPLYHWVCIIGEFWEECISSNYTVGHRDSILKEYNSQIPNLLLQLVHAIDKSITKQQIETALREYNKTS